MGHEVGLGVEREGLMLGITEQVEGCEWIDGV